LKSACKCARVSARCNTAQHAATEYAMQRHTSIAAFSKLHSKRSPTYVYRDESTPRACTAGRSRRPRGLLFSTTCNTQHRACNTQHRACNTQHLLTSFLFLNSALRLNCPSIACTRMDSHAHTHAHTHAHARTSYIHMDGSVVACATPPVPSIAAGKQVPACLPACHTGGCVGCCAADRGRGPWATPTAAQPRGTLTAPTAPTAEPAVLAADFLARVACFLCAFLLTALVSTGLLLYFTEYECGIRTKATAPRHGCDVRSCGHGCAC
jgi:hypothetical protein